MFEKIIKFETALAKFTGAKYAISTDCCTHAIEMCLRYDQIKDCKFTAYTYLSIPMTMHKLKISYELLEQSWIGEYQFVNTRIWDSARRLEPNMYRSGNMQCLSFGYGKPVNNIRGGAILLDDKTAYDALSMMRYDGRNIAINPWISQYEFNMGFHYKLNPEECVTALKRLKKYIKANDFLPKHVQYPDCRRITIL
jgi:dTDP-4-amino-4,6-dideoxygalactose transaminase